MRFNKWRWVNPIKLEIDGLITRGAEDLAYIYYPTVT